MERIKIHKSLTSDRIMDAVESDDYIGFCIKCGAEHYGIDPDAIEYSCEACGEESVYGAPELMIMGYAE